MLFSVPEHTWWLIGAMATVVLMMTMERFSAVAVEEAPEELRDEAESLRKAAVRVVFAGIPAFFAVAVLLDLLSEQQDGLYLFLYGVAAVSMAVALLPFRRRMYRRYFAQLLTGEKITTDRLSSVWICTTLLVPALAVSALLATLNRTA
ncbi:MULTISPECIES: hypothetical protein [unclassified Streptomyces]|uniref:hypothetical protein n=1 Tax=unclassified Streptomyces TaxID=2593676 RepID=UPI0006AD8C80|nr:MULTISPECIES: hypothetical protein [unclassified Streptomyces]KOX23777.1 hypothetical protein ADL06_21865 [Streptomyces sp. NRRL F-6491]KOX40763.1 hypothetical protein ADL08_21350 [Streptomyces sp. NRRL F-6492]